MNRLDGTRIDVSALILLRRRRTQWHREWWEERMVMDISESQFSLLRPSLVVIYRLISKRHFAIFYSQEGNGQGTSVHGACVAWRGIDPRRKRGSIPLHLCCFFYFEQNRTRNQMEGRKNIMAFHKICTCLSCLKKLANCRYLCVYFSRRPCEKSMLAGSKRPVIKYSTAVEMSCGTCYKCTSGMRSRTSLQTSTS